MSKQTIDSKGLTANAFTYEDHINGPDSLLTAMAVTRAELAILRPVGAQPDQGHRPQAVRGLGHR
jgi:hypothetical protein